MHSHAGRITCFLPHSLWIICQTLCVFCGFVAELAAAARVVSVSEV